MTITIRAVKGVSLTHDELDENFTDLRDLPSGLILPKTKNVGMKVDTAAPDYGWHDIVGMVATFADDANRASIVDYRGGIKALRFAVNKNAFVNFHIPHDYAMGTDIFIHVHWSHASATLTGGSVTWGFETMYAKGHNQGAFQAPKGVSLIHAASPIQYQHMIGETAMSVTGGSTDQLDTTDIEPDGIIQVRLYLDSNDLIDTVIAPDPFVHFVDVHYQSTNVATKNKAPDFWT